MNMNQYSFLEGEKGTHNGDYLKIVREK